MTEPRYLYVTRERRMTDGSTVVSIEVDGDTYVAGHVVKHADAAVRQRWHATRRGGRVTKHSTKSDAVGALAAGRYSEYTGRLNDLWRGAAEHVNRENERKYGRR